MLMQDVDYNYSMYFFTQLPSRLLNCFNYLLLGLLGTSFILSRPVEEQKRIVLFFFLGTMVQAYSGIWQWLHFHTGIPFLPTQARTKFHSVSSVFSKIFVARVTALSNEPSYIGPLMIDGALLGTLFVRDLKKYILLVLLPCIFTLFASFSFGGYFNAIIIFAVYFLAIIVNSISRNRVQMSIIYACSTVATLAFLLSERLLQITLLVASRFDTFFDVRSHGRLFMVAMPTLWFSEDGLIPSIFGHGPGSYKILGKYRIIPSNGMPVHTTSHNIFTDFLYESGALGLLSLSVFFLLLISHGLTRFRTSRYYALGALLAFHLLVSEQYLGGFMSPRFWVLLICIFFIYHIGHIDALAKNRGHSTGTSV